MTDETRPAAGRYVPFFGCVIGAKYPQMEAAARRVFDRLDVELVDVEGFSCCPDPIYFKAVDKLDWLTLAARNLCLVERQGLDLVTFCSGCTSTLREADHLLKSDPELRERVNRRLERLGYEFRGRLRVRHAVTVLRDDVGFETVRETVRAPLKGLEVALHYGCHLLKPASVMEVDDPDRPGLLEALIELTGATPVSHALQLQCCGRGCMDADVPGEMLFDILSSVEAGPGRCIALVCPTCFDQLELGQMKVGRARGVRFRIPVLYYFQLLGLAQGFDEQEMGLQYHRIKPVPLLAELGLSSRQQSSSAPG